MEHKWQCRFKNLHEPITVGQKLLMVCEGEPKINFKEPIHIQFLDNKHNYSLYVLKTLNKEGNFLALEVTSYRTGELKNPFIITDGEQGFVIEDFSFHVQSVLKSEKQQAKAYGPFGPFKPPLPLWYLTTMGISFFCFLVCILIFVNRLLKRKKHIQNILNRKTYLNPAKSFIIGLRKQKNDWTQTDRHLEKLFKIFLEDHFFIPAIDKSDAQIMKLLKKYHYSVYKREGQNIRRLLNEFSFLKQKNVDKKTLLELKKLCQKMVFALDNKRTVK